MKFYTNNKQKLYNFTRNTSGNVNRVDLVNHRLVAFACGYTPNVVHTQHILGKR